MLYDEFRTQHSLWNIALEMPLDPDTGMLTVGKGYFIVELLQFSLSSR